MRGHRPLLLATALILLLLPRAATAQAMFTATETAEAIATATVACDRCAWDVEGREAVVFRVTLDGRYVQHLPVVRGGRADYRLLLGAVDPGPHTVRIEEDRDLTARDLRGGHASVDSVVVTQVAASDPAHRALSLAPFVYARPDTVGRFTDVPVFMWYETEQTPRGTRYIYSVVFTNEDGGTPADRLMATWGRTTDIEYVYGVEVDAAGAILGEDIQGPKHEILAFRGKREGRHPLLWVTTDNNMVLDAGKTAVRYAPAPLAVTFAEVSRETVMDAHPWLYAVMAQELMREGKIAPNAPAGKGRIPDPRRFAYLEGCGEAGGAALAFAVQVEGMDSAPPAWVVSDRGRPDFRITRDGCFRVAIPLPDSVTSSTGREIRGLRVRAYTRPKGDSPPPPIKTVRLARITRAFMLDQQYRPGPSFMTWTGSVTLQPDGPPVQLLPR